MTTEQNEKTGNRAINQVNTMDNEEDVIDLMDLFYVLKGHLVSIILVTILAGILGFFGTKFLVKPTYESTAKIYVVSASNNSVVNLSDLQIGSQLTSDYEELFVSRPVLQDVIDNLSLDYTTKQLANMIDVTNISDTRILAITVTTTDANLSSEIANELVNQGVQHLPEVMETEAPNVVEAAIPATEKAGPSLTKNAAIAALVGMLAMCAIYIVKYLMNDTLVTPDDVEKYLGFQPLASIPEAKGKGKKKKGRK